MSMRGGTKGRGEGKHHRGSVWILLAAIFGSLLPATPGVAYQRPGETERVSISSGGDEGNGPSGGGCRTSRPAITPDGRYVAFTSNATNLDPADRNGKLSDVFVHDRKSRTTKIVSVNSRGVAPPPPPPVLDRIAESCGDWSAKPAISDNGRFVAFSSHDNLLDPIQDRNPGADVFVHDRRRNETEVVSLPDDDAALLGDAGTDDVAISGNGRFVGFASGVLPNAKCPETQLIPGVEAPPELGLPKLCRAQIFVRDRLKEKTILVSRSPSGRMANDHNNFKVGLSSKGRYVAFSSTATNLTDHDYQPCIPTKGINGCPQIFLHDLRTKKTELVSVTRDGQPGDGSSSLALGQAGGVVSSNGRYVVFLSGAANLVPTTSMDTPLSVIFGEINDVFVRDLKLQRTERVSITSSGAISKFFMDMRITDNGRFVMASVRNLTSDDTYCQTQGGHVVVHDRLLGSTTPLAGSANSACQVEHWHTGGISRDARYLTFSSTNPNVVADDGSHVEDVFVHDRGSPLAVGDLGRALRTRASGARLVAGVASATARAGNAPLAGERWADIIQARLVYRPDLDDLFVKIDLDRLALLEGLPAAGPLGSPAQSVYVLSLIAGDLRYEVRAQPSPIHEGNGRFALFRCSASRGNCVQAASLSGGIGTVGDNVVVSLPLEYLGLAAGQVPHNFHVAAGYGSLELGLVEGLDHLRVSGE